MQLPPPSGQQPIKCTLRNLGVWIWSSWVICYALAIRDCIDKTLVLVAGLADVYLALSRRSTFSPNFI